MSKEFVIVCNIYILLAFNLQLEYGFWVFKIWFLQIKFARPGNGVSACWASHQGCSRNLNVRTSAFANYHCYSVNCPKSSVQTHYLSRLAEVVKRMFCACLFLFFYYTDQGSILGRSPDRPPSKWTSTVLTRE
jgi:hypothetical protein